MRCRRKALIRSLKHVSPRAQRSKVWIKGYILQGKYKSTIKEKIWWSHWWSFLSVWKASRSKIWDERKNYRDFGFYNFWDFDISRLPVKYTMKKLNANIQIYNKDYFFIGLIGYDNLRLFSILTIVLWSMVESKSSKYWWSDPLGSHKNDLKSKFPQMAIRSL